MRLSNLLKAIEYVAYKDPGPASENTRRRTPGADGPADQSKRRDPEIASVHYRAQDVQPGGLFVAIKGLAADGHDFINEAAARGAAAIIVQKPTVLPRPEQNHGRQDNNDPIIIETVDSRRALAAVSGRFFGAPSEHMAIVGITGTNGKTTTAHLIESMLSQAGFRVGVIGTLNYRYSGKKFNNPMTTPESLDLQRIMADMRDDNVSHVVMEVTSHAIDLLRIENCYFDVGVFTNLTQDHLDYHGDMNAYWSCKKKLFTRHLPTGPKSVRARAVVNCDDEKGKALSMLKDLTIVTAGQSKENMIRPRNIHYDLTGIKGKISTPAGAFEVASSLVGKYNLENILCAAGTGIALGLSLDAVEAGINMVAGVPGRLERIENDIGRFVYVDYAHSPDALENVLSCLKSLANGRMVCVFGCGGNRDRGKRPRMGEIAARFCDLTVVTSDNPRTESPLDIIAQVIEGTKRVASHRYAPSDLVSGFKRHGYIAEPDRRKAIRLGISSSKPGDTILIAGKGDETYQIIGDKTIPFDDREEAKRAIEVIHNE